jgi:G3E family GTPase
MTQLAPVSVITGFLGSGKTTLLNRLLRQPDMRGAAVIVNELGEIGIDHLLVESAIEDAVLLRSGCICCTVRGDLIDTLGSLRARMASGALPAFDRVMVETTGLADPAPILQTLMSDASLTPHYRLGSVVATADAVNAPSQLDRFDEAVKQIALADRLVVTKTDLVPAAATDAVIARLRHLNDAAPIIRLPDDSITPDRLFDASLFEPRGRPPDIARWLGAPDHPRHDGAIKNFCLTRDAPVPWPAFKAWLESVVSLRGADLLRLKGIVNVADDDRPVVVHGVQHVFHPPTRLPRWPDQDRRTRLVFITRKIEQAPLAAALEAFIADR